MLWVEEQDITSTSVKSVQNCVTVFIFLIVINSMRKTVGIIKFKYPPVFELITMINFSFQSDLIPQVNSSSWLKHQFS